MKNLTIEWMVKQIYKYKFLFVLGAVIGAAGTLGIYTMLPKKYKTIGKINVSPKYFQNPMMMDFLPTVYDSTELKAERESAITGSISPEFLNAMLDQYVPNAKNLSALERDTELVKLKKNFEIFRESTSVFQVGAIANTPEKAFEMSSALMSEIVYTARTSRTRYLEQLRDSVKTRLQSLNGAEMTSTSVAEINHQIGILELQKKEMSVQFNSNHPDIVAVNSKIASLKKMKQGGASQDRVYNTQSIDPTQKANTDIKSRLQEDLMKKYQSLEIVLDLESKENNLLVSVVEAPLRSQTPISPQLTIFLSFGLLIGLFLGVSFVAIKSRDEMLEEMEDDFAKVDPVTGKKIDRRKTNINNDYISMDQ